MNAAAQSFIASGEINATQSYTKGFDPQVLQDSLNDAQIKVKTYIETLDANTTTLYDIIGGKKIITQYSDMLPSSLPNHPVVIGARYAKLPSTLQQRMEFYLRGMSQEFAIDELMHGKKSITLPMARLNNEKVTLSFAPASQADQEALEALLPEGEITDESQLPSHIPSYIHVKPQIKLNGTVIQELGETALAQKYTLAQKLTTPTRTITFGQPRLIITGGYYAINTIVQSISAGKLKALQQKIKQTQETLQSSDQTQLDALTREDILGDMVYAASLSYYAQLIAQSKMATRPLGAHFELAGSSGIIGYKPKIANRFGVPTGLSAGGMNCDLIDRDMIQQTDTDINKRIQAN